MTIRSKLILLYSGLLAIIIVAFGISVFEVTRWVLVNSVDSTLSATADQIWQGSHIGVTSEFGEPSQPVIFLPHDLDFFGASGVFIQIWELTPDMARLIKTSSNLNYTDKLDPAALNEQEQAFQNGSDALNSNNTVNIGGGEWRVRTDSNDIQGWRFVIQAATSFDTINQSSQGLVVIILIATGIALIGSVALGLGLTSRVLRPIDDITRSAEKIAAANDLKTRLTWSGPMDELGRLISVYNAMMTRLEHLFSVQQRFVADVSHELRTPLTAIRGNIDLIKRYGMDQESLDAIDSEAQRMARLVNDLLLLARADNGELKLNLEEIDLDILVSEAYREARILAKDRDLKITVLDFEPVRIKGDPDRLKQLLFNLINNAIKFTPDGGQIILSLGKSEHNAVIQVQDTGIGIAPDDLKRIFNRFYQADASRARTLSTEGAGLGLSIVQWIAEAHGGKIQVESRVGEGTTFTVTLPHIEVPEHVLSAAVTRPRLSIIRRNAAPEKEKENLKP